MAVILTILTIVVSILSIWKLPLYTLQAVLYIMRKMNYTDIYILDISAFGDTDDLHDVTDQFIRWFIGFYILTVLSVLIYIMHILSTGVIYPMYEYFLTI